MRSCRDSLVEDNVKLVYFMFSKLRQNSITISYKDDLISDGMVGLVKAAKRFDESKNIKFSSFAAICIRNEMLMAIRKLSKFIGNEVSLFMSIGVDADGSELYLSDILEDSSPQPQDCIVAEETKAFIFTQKDLDKKIAAARLYGFTQREISEQLHLSQSYISRRLRNLNKKLLSIV